MINLGEKSLFNSLGLIWSRLFPSWAEQRIDSGLFLLNNQHGKAIRSPRGFSEQQMKTPHGLINVYQFGAGPAVVFVHGWGGGAYQFFSLMRGLKACGFSAIAFDHLGHEKSEKKPATLEHMIATTNLILQWVQKNHNEGLYSVVAHGLGCMVTTNVRPALIKDLPLFMISPIFNYKLYFLKKLGSLSLHPKILQQYAQRFVQRYSRDYKKMELPLSLARYADDTVIAHDKNDDITPLADSEKFCQDHPLTKLLTTSNTDHFRIISSETVWAELKSHINYEDTTINFSSIVLEEIMGQQRTGRMS